EAGKGHKWKLAVRLDNTFRFLLRSALEASQLYSHERSLFLSWLAGFVDADGSIHIGENNCCTRISLGIGNTDKALLEHMRTTLASIGYHSDGPYLTRKAGTRTPLGISYRNDFWLLQLQRSEEVRRLLNELPIRHAEK